MLFRFSAGATLPSTFTEYAQAVAAFDAERRRQFYETLAQNLTICVRGIWSDEQASDFEKVDRLKWLNEIQHRVVGKLRASHPWPDEEFFAGVLAGGVEHCSALQGEVDWAVKQAFSFASAPRPAISPPASVD